MRMRVRDMPEGDRPRERLLAGGVQALADRELLALLLGSGTAGTDAIELASLLIASQGDLGTLAGTEACALQRLPGIGPAKAARVAAAFELARRAGRAPDRRTISGSADLAEAAAPLLHGLRHERLVVVVCDQAGRVLRVRPLTEGAADRCPLPVREVLAVAFAAGGAAFGVAHNHPSGILAPSEPDRRATDRLREAADAVGLRFLDHVIVTDAAWVRIP